MVNSSRLPSALKISTVALLLMIIMTVLTLPAQAKVTRYLKGNSADVNPTLAGPAYNFGGGGPDVDEAIQWMINQVRGCTDCATKVDVVVIRSSGNDGYNDAIASMNGVDSVETLVITSRDDSQKANVVNPIKNAEAIFFAGGDQCEYTRNFKNTAVEAAVKSVNARGGAIGGTSAGSMIQSDFVYNACSDTVETREALEDPYEDISFTYDFFKWANMKATLVDTHFSKRDRMGRTMTFIARQIRDGISDSALGIAVDENTSVVVDKNGMARVMEGAAYFVLADHMPEVCEPQTPLTFSNYKIWKVKSGDTFNLKNRPTSGYYLRSVNKGRLSSDPY
ncbi:MULTISPECIES: cyanophycinase [Cyanophyceae]|uniref:cyanophycinase n=1 Tax=Cyanophyceae TaxID=3028117 RepID=UPI0018EF5C4B|nr:Type 1 glutamine amidotransferase-like domain-containing protein [Trichocoleus sp. FACHB-40]